LNIKNVCISGVLAILITICFSACGDNSDDMTYYAIDHDVVSDVAVFEDEEADIVEDEVAEVTEDIEESEADLAEVEEDDPEKEGTIFSAVYADLTTEEKIELLRDFFPDGAYWNYHDYQDTVKDESKYQAAMHISTTPCENFGSSSSYWCNAYNGITKKMFSYEGDNIQCLGFASMISDFLWGEETPIYLSYNYDDIEVGDHIRLIDWEHSITVIEKTDTAIKVVEVNRDYNDCLIEWDREITREYLEKQKYEILKRGENPDGETFYYESDFTDRQDEHEEQIKKED
jgi:hypothetical protein